MSKKKKTAPIAETKKVYVYVGPSIRGVIQTCTIYFGTEDEVLKKLAFAIEKYPKIKKLLVEGKDVANTRKLIHNGTSTYSIAYKELASI